MCMDCSGASMLSQLVGSHVCLVWVARYCKKIALVASCETYWFALHLSYTCHVHMILIQLKLNLYYIKFYIWNSVIFFFQSVVHIVVHIVVVIVIVVVVVTFFFGVGWKIWNHFWKVIRPHFIDCNHLKNHQSTSLCILGTWWQFWILSIGYSDCQWTIFRIVTICSKCIKKCSDGFLSGYIR